MATLVSMYDLGVSSSRGPMIVICEGLDNG